MSEFKKIMSVMLPFDRRAKEPGKNYGIAGMETTHVLQGPLGAVQFKVGWPIYLPHVETERNWSESFRGRTPMGYDVGYHSAKPMFEGQEPMKGPPCPYVEGGVCYYDGSSLRADDWAQEIFSTDCIGKHPEEEIWKRLEQEYKETFNA